MGTLAMGFGRWFESSLGQRLQCAAAAGADFGGACR